MSTRYNEEHLVQKPTAEFLQNELGWDSINAYSETYGPAGTLGRSSDREVILTRYLLPKLREFNPGLPEEAYKAAIRQIEEYSSSQSMESINQEKYDLLKRGVPVSYRNDKGESKKETLRIFDFKTAENNHFLCVREFRVKGDIYRRRADIVGFVNGIPLLFMELKNINKDIQFAYDQNFSDYKDTIPHLFHHNAFIILGNGDEAKVGTLTSKFKHFRDWKRLSEEDPGVVDMVTLLKGICNKPAFMDLFENFILFDDSSGEAVKIMAQNHQYLGVNRAIEAVKNRHQRKGKLGVFWHTQGSGKSYSMVFFTGKVRRKLGSNFTFLICTDREDLDSQIYKTFSGCGLVDNDKDPCRASSGENLKELLSQHKSYVFSLIQKFNQDVPDGDAYSFRDDIIVISDEAHRTNYGRLALNMRNALPNANYIGFTGTPLFKNDEITRQVFGDYISTYDFQRAVEDNATVPLYYDARGDKLNVVVRDLNKQISEKIEEIDFDELDFNTEQRLENDLKRNYHVFTAQSRLEQVALDFVEHYTTAWESGKTMLVCLDKITSVRMHGIIRRFWQERMEKLETEVRQATDEQNEVYLKRKLNWMKETQIAVVISEEQGEVEKFRKWGLDILPHRKLIKDGFETPDGKRIDLESAFKKVDHPFRIAIVCAMWLTGFDVPSLSTLYLDKPLKAHTLMQTIARANRVHEGKNNGLIVDYCGILKNLRSALATYAGRGNEIMEEGAGTGGPDPAQPADEMLPEQLAEAIAIVRAFLEERGATLDAIIENSGFERNASINAAKEAANENDETRKRFEVMCREVFKKFKACITIEGVNDYRRDYDAINIVYRKLQEDRAQADISGIIRELHKIVDGAIATGGTNVVDDNLVFNIATIDFERLRKEFERSTTKKTTVQNLRQAIEDRLASLLKQNPLRTDFQKHYENIVEEYNREKDRATIEKTFEALVTFVQILEEEESRAIKEGLDEESLAVFDLLKKPNLQANEIKQIKKVAVDLLQTLKAEKLRVDNWREKESTRDAVRGTIYDFLYRVETGLPEESFSEDDVKEKTEEVFRHVYRVYPKLPSPIFVNAS